MDRMRECDIVAARCCKAYVCVCTCVWVGGWLGVCERVFMYVCVCDVCDRESERQNKSFTVTDLNSHGS